MFNKVVEKIQDIRSPRRIEIFSMKDLKAGEFTPPFHQPNAAAALRVFKMEINRADPQNLAYHYPEDFELYSLGTINLDTGEIQHEVKLLAKGPQVKN